mgnify:CR=1 FL=1
MRNRVGEDFWPSAYDRTVCDEIIAVSDADSFDMTRRLAREEGLLVGGSAMLVTLPVAFGLAWLLARGRFPGKVLLDGVVHLPLVVPPVVTVAATDPTATEAAGDTGTFTFTRSGGDTTAALTVNFSFAGGTAGRTTDYDFTGVSSYLTATTANVVFGAGQLTKTLTVTGIVDALADDGETVNVAVIAGPASGDGVYTSGTPSSGATGASGSPSITTCRALRVRRPRCCSHMLAPARRPFA